MKEKRAQKSEKKKQTKILSWLSNYADAELKNKKKMIKGKEAEERKKS